GSARSIYLCTGGPREEFEAGIASSIARKNGQNGIGYTHYVCLSGGGDGHTNGVGEGRGRECARQAADRATGPGASDVGHARRGGRARAGGAEDQWTSVCISRGE